MEGESVQTQGDIRQVNEEILKKVLKCEVTGREYKITPQELKFYQRMKVPLPKRHPDQRHYDRLKLHDAHRLWERKCAKCGKNIQTIYIPENKNIVYCEECYLKEIY